jgi:hypothetical protein
MYQNKPDVTDEELGIRAFKVKRAKAVERAIERLRHGLGPAWADLTEEEIEELDWVLGEEWSYVARSQWEDLHFGRLTMSDVVRILTLSSQLRRHARNHIEILREIASILGAEGDPTVPKP